MNTASGELVTVPAGLPAEIASTNALVFTKGRAIDAMPVESDDDYTVMAGLVQDVGSIAKAVDKIRMDANKPDADRIQARNDYCRPIASECDRANRVGKKKMADYHTAKENARKKAEAEAAERRRQEQERAEREAREAREAAQRRAEAEAEAEKKKAAEARAAAEAQMQKAVDAGDTKAAVAAAREIDAVDASESKALETIETERTAVVAATAAPTIIAPVVSTYIPPTPKVTGVAVRKVWKFEVEDKAKLIMAAAERARAGDTMLLSLLVPDETAIRQLVLSLKENCNIPGVRAWEENDISAGRGRGARR